MAILKSNETQNRGRKKKTRQGSGRFTKFSKNPKSKRYVKKTRGQGGRKR